MTQRKRLEAIDQYRGFAILLMIVANYLSNIDTIPGWLKHAPDIGFTIVDLVAPLFVFAIGLTYGLSFQGRLARNGAWQTYTHFISRYSALLGIGYLVTLVWEFSGIDPPETNWGLLQALGAAGLIGLPFIQLAPRWRWLAGAGLLLGYQFLLDRYWLDVVLRAPHNGPWGALSWGAMLILATAMADLYYAVPRGQRLFPLVSGGVAAGGLILALIVPLSKARASASYVLLSLGLSGLVFFLFHLLDTRWELQLPVLSDWGRNPLLLYLLHYVLLAVFVLPPIPGWYVAAPLWLILLQLGALLAFLSWVGLFLNRRRLYFVL